jgi:hypothetical protein
VLAKAWVVVPALSLRSSSAQQACNSVTES